jgi:beta-phosphoglucomutase-like phosphatase (HAD superfamily)
MMPHFVSVPKHIPPLLRSLGKNHRIYLASNAIEDFCTESFKMIGVPIDGMRSAQNFPAKPDPAMYLDIMRVESATGRETVIFEDSRFGLQAAFAAKANVYVVRDPWDLDEYSVGRFLKCLTS